MCMCEWLRRKKSLFKRSSSISLCISSNLFLQISAHKKELSDRVQNQEPQDLKVFLENLRTQQWGWRKIFSRSTQLEFKEEYCHSVLFT